jgi:hypothetical protein
MPTVVPMSGHVLGSKVRNKHRGQHERFYKGLRVAKEAKRWELQERRRNKHRRQEERFYKGLVVAEAMRRQCDAACATADARQARQRLAWAEVQACIRVQRMWRGYNGRAKVVEAIQKHREAAKIQARMRGCFAREKLESDVRREITHEHPWNPRVPSMRLQVLRSNERRMLKMRQHIKLSMPITYAAATAARKRQFLRRCGGNRECTLM